MNSAIISDLHLCEEEPENLKFPLWKKYKTAEFFFDKEFSQFIDWIQQQSDGSSTDVKTELIFNGDTFDFDSVCSLPEQPIYRLSWLEKRRGLRAEPIKSVFKMEKILNDHPDWTAALKKFLQNGHRVIFITGNHDVEILFPEVQQVIRQTLDTNGEFAEQIVFADWFYISAKDTLVEHGHQYDPYCVMDDPIRPFTKRFNRIEVKLPFGNLATRYILNGMGFFNPHSDSNYIMGILEYVRFFFKYMIHAQPMLILTWFWGSLVTLYEATKDNFAIVDQDPLSIEDRIEDIAVRSKATSRMVREMRALSVPSAAKNVLQIARELWLDRALMLLAVLYVLFTLFLIFRQMVPLSWLWILAALSIFLPFFLFYSGSVQSKVLEFKEPSDRILALSSMVTKVTRVVYGHTHIPRHELFGPVEHLNSGTWSPAFSDVECTQPIGNKTFVWISPDLGIRKAKLMNFSEGTAATLS